VSHATSPQFVHLQTQSASGVTSVHVTAQKGHATVTKQILAPLILACNVENGVEGASHANERTDAVVAQISIGYGRGVDWDRFQDRSRSRGKERDGGIAKEGEREREKDKERDRERERERRRERDRDKARERDIDTERDRERDRKRDSESEIDRDIQQARGRDGVGEREENSCEVEPGGIFIRFAEDSLSQVTKHVLESCLD